MSNFLLIARREYLEAVRSRMFIFMTIFLPMLLFCVAVLPTLLVTRLSGEAKHLVVVAPDQTTAQLIRDQLLRPAAAEESTAIGAQATSEDQQGSNRPSRFEAEIDTNVAEAERDALSEKVRAKQIDGVIWASPEALASRKIEFITRDISSFADNYAIQQRINSALRRESLRSKGLTDGDIESALKPVDLKPRSPFGNGTPNAQTAFLSVFLMVMVLFTTVLLYGISVMRSVLEEKTSRIVEVVLSTATPQALMTGKILGVGAVGLTQVGIWVATGSAFFMVGPLAALAGALRHIISFRTVVFFPIFFLLGYVLYSTLCAAVGSMVNSEQEAQQMQFFIMTPMILAVIVLVNIIQHPGTPVAFWASMFPPTAPLIMFTRIALEPQIPWWQIALSLALLVATIYGAMWLCARIYRIGILMYGKKPTLPEVMKWIKYA